MEALAVEGLRMIPEDFRESIDELEGGISGAVKREEDEEAKVKPVVKKVRRLLYRRMKVEVQDGRVFVGKFHCLDKQGNIILYDTVEFRNVGVAPAEQRSLGLVLIPARWRISCHVESSLDEKMNLLTVGS
ncbi:hypothetical protein KC19_9G188000 [Ceratodon purpureus]|uniref:Sm domain-containing protein n=1 Tax=Ceratodon purpureus TaxID=3225 RepID=A0A8T0H1K5_CERPU|nr:hypothetical protein KC19_9G188000 [Ceratodon purpureus]